jgi:hypothetical protein
MANVNGKRTPHQNGQNKGASESGARKVSKLGQRLREISDKALASGVERLSTEQIHELIAEIRGRSA